MNSIEDANYCIKSLNSGEDLSLCSFWYSTQQTGIFPLCKLWVLQKESLFYSDSEILSSSCNSSLILDNFYSRLRSSFKNKTSEFDFNFIIDDEENTGNLELRLKIDPKRDSYISAFKVTLIKSFRGIPVQEFMKKVSEVCQIKDRIISDQQKEIHTFSDLNNQIFNTQTQVKMMREETGVKLAAKFMVLLNQIKEKSAKPEQEGEHTFENKDLPLTQSKKKFKGT